MRSFVQILTTPTADTPGTTLLLHFDNKRYLIGSLAEGTQRACFQVGARLLKVSEFFVTGRTEWSNFGGLLGMTLTLADSVASSQASILEEAMSKAKAKASREKLPMGRDDVRKLEAEVRRENKKNNTLTLFGPPNMNYLLATARRFIFRKGMPVNVHEIRDGLLHQDPEDQWAPYWTDKNIKVWAMPILPPTESESNRTMGGTRSPRKRTMDEVNGEGSALNVSSEDNLSSEQRDLLTTKAVVAEMFDSSWRLDTLHETPLSNVRMPAAIFIRDPETKKVERYHGPLPGGEQPLPDPDLTVLVRRPWPGALVESLPHTEPAKEAVSYIIRNHVQRGKFKPDVAKALKVEQGFKWSELAAGNSVTNADGETVTSAQVLGESREGGGIAVIDLPDVSYIDNLIKRPEWQEPKVMTGVGAVVWICGKGVIDDPRIGDFMKQHSQMKHIVSSPDCCPNQIAMDSSAAATVRLRKIDPVRYTIPEHDNDSARDDQLGAIGAVIAARGQTVLLEPALELQDKEVVPPLNIEAVEKEMLPEVLDDAAKAHQAIEADKEEEAQWSVNIPSKDAEIITLGTGSALPSKYRNVSATLLRVPGWGSMLFDCGENTLGQLKRALGAEELKQVLQELRIVFISHMHADHHLGTVGVIKAWYNEVHNGQPASSDSLADGMLNDHRRLAIISEPAMLHWLMEYSSVEDYGFSRLAPLHISVHERSKNRPSKLGWFVPPTELANLTHQERLETHKRNTILPSTPFLKLADIQAVAVQHCHGARAVSVTFPPGLKVSYSGDCRPSKAFAHIGKGSHVCIHEATFDDELQIDAEAKNHSTTSEALGVAQMMGAKAVILTHFSQRYQKLPVLEHQHRDDEQVQEIEMLDASSEEEGEDSDLTNPEMATESGPLEGEDTTDVAATFPDQPTTDTAGQQYELSSSKLAGKRKNFANDASVGAGPAAVKLRVSSDMKVGVAFDYMRVKVGEIGQLEKFTPALLKLFAEEDKLDEKVEVKEGVESKKSKKEKRSRGRG